MWKRLLNTLQKPVLWLLISLGAANGCGRFYGDSASLRSTLGDRQQLRVATVAGIWTRLQSQNLSWGLEADLLQDFAESSGIQLQFQVFPNAEKARQSLYSGQSDVAALHASGSVRSQVQAGPIYQESSLALICPKNLTDKNPLILIADRHESFALRDELKSRKLTNLKSVGWKLEKIFAQAAEAPSTCVVTEISEARSAIQAYPQMKISESSLVNQPLRFWISRKDPKLENALIYWQQKISQDGTLARIRDRYLLPLNILSLPDLQLLLDSGDEFKLYESLFKDSAQDHRLPWALVAAVSFQESHWQNEARSFTGVRGLMMLTEDAADHVGIENRVDPEQSIWGGAKYLKFLWESFPSRLADRERLALTLAAYNVGFGHLRDAQSLAAHRGLDPYAWRDLRKVLPLLSEPRIAKSLEFGQARGQEPVDFTERTLAYFDLIQALHGPAGKSLDRH